MEIKDYDQIKKDILGKITNISLLEGSFTDSLISATSLELEKLYTELEHVYNNIFLVNLNTEDLEYKCAEKGIERKLGTKSEGIITVTGLPNTIISTGTLMTTDTGLNYLTTEEKTIVENTIDIKIIAENIGEIYNIKPNTITNLPIQINGIIGITNTNEVKGGTNDETDEELLNRLIESNKAKATSGNIEHYKLWCKEVNGIGDSKVFPLWNGNGTVQVLPVTTDKRAPIESKILEVANYIETKRPVGATVTVQAPTEVAININATIKTNINANLEDIKTEYTTKATQYIKDSVYKLQTVDYNRLLSIFYTIDGVEQVTDFKLNNGIVNITIGDKEIQTIGTINITEGV